jgi:hypothetical protein
MACMILVHCAWIDLGRRYRKHGGVLNPGAMWGDVRQTRPTSYGIS